jgi:hypothetical protein
MANGRGSEYHRPREKISHFDQRFTGQTLLAAFVRIRFISSLFSAGQEERIKMSHSLMQLKNHL